ncbi:MAG: hypothetical protein ABL958_15545, partial [Bdellovibrionia bacterium]
MSTSKILAGIVGLVCILTANPGAASAPSGCNDPVFNHDFRFKDLLKIIDSNPEIKSIADLVPCLPRSYRINFVLMHDSTSRQGSNFLFPRVISFGGAPDNHEAGGSSF